MGKLKRKNEKEKKRKGKKGRKEFNISSSWESSGHQSKIEESDLRKDMNQEPGQFGGSG